MESNKTFVFTRKSLRYALKFEKAKEKLQIFFAYTYAFVGYTILHFFLYFD